MLYHMLNTNGIVDYSLCYAGLCYAMPRYATLLPHRNVSAIYTFSNIKERNQPRPRMTVDVLKRHLARLQSRHLMPRAELERRLAEFGGVSVSAVEDFVVRLVLGGPRFNVFERPEEAAAARFEPSAVFCDG